MSDINKKKSTSKLTPMMQQHHDIKKDHPDAFLFFRCGDFYELFGQDAVEASSILDITLTKRGNTPMCGVPYHSVDSYIGKMLDAGKKIAICNQMEDPKLAKGIVKRSVVEVISPGTILSENFLKNKCNNFILSLNRKGLTIEIAYLDVSTGDFFFNEIEYTKDLFILKGEIFRIAPREIIIAEDIWQQDNNLRIIFDEFENILINRFPQWYFESQDNKKKFFLHFSVSDWEELGIHNFSSNLTAPGTLFHYVKNNVLTDLSHVKKLVFLNEQQKMILDETTIKSLELIKNLQDGTTLNTLLEILDKTITSMGGRLIKKWIVEPLVKKNEIDKRLATVNYLYKQQRLLLLIEKTLKDIMDLERLVSRIVVGKAGPKDLVSIKNSLIGCNTLFDIVKSHNILTELFNNFVDLSQIITIINNAIKDEPATFSNDGNIVKDGYIEELDKLKKITFDTKEYLLHIEKDAKAQYNTPSLKIKYNKILGYFFEVSKNQSKNLDNTFILRQSLVNTHRYTTEELSKHETEILEARDKINKIEEGVFNDVKNKVLEKIHDIQINAKIIAKLDIFVSFANVALRNHYTMPNMNNSGKIIVTEGRHPVIEQKLDTNQFIANDLLLDTDQNYISIITGPNMSGKSTYLRQNALITLMAQIGSFVPAQSADIGIVDRIFTRVGASDNIARGQSTFLVEMSETANILKNATNKSLIIMDEIGRGTSTYDGMSIAWAVLEYIRNKKFLGAKTLFATHYHELTKLEEKEGINNLSVAVSEENNTITFLHKIIDEPAEKSYGIYVAKLSGIPEEVVIYSEGILNNLEKENYDSPTDNHINVKNKLQLDLFEDFTPKKESRYKEIINYLEFLDIDRITPLQALNIMADLKKKIKKKR